MRKATQGDVLKVDRILYPVLVVSRNEFNEMGEVVVCPLLQNTSPNAVHSLVSYAQNGRTIRAMAACEQVRHLDLNARRFTVTGTVDLFTMMEISDILVSLFEYL